MSATKGKPGAATAGSGAGRADDGQLPPRQSYWQVSATAGTGTPEGIRVLNSCLGHCAPTDLGFCSSVQQGKHTHTPPIFPAVSIWKSRGRKEWEVLQQPEGAEEERPQQQGRGPALEKEGRAGRGSSWTGHGLGRVEVLGWRRLEVQEGRMDKDGGDAG